MRQPLVWIAVPLMLIGALLLVTGVGAAGLWIAVIAAGIALVALDVYRRREGPRHQHQHAQPTRHASPAVVRPYEANGICPRFTSAKRMAEPLAELTRLPTSPIPRR